VTIRDRKSGDVTSSAIWAADAGPAQRLQRDAAIAVASQLGMAGTDQARAFPSFGGVKRRFTPYRERNGVQVFDDYGHHPVEIKAVLHAARESTEGKVIAVMQPHRYSRLHACSTISPCFNDADDGHHRAGLCRRRAADRGRGHTDLVSRMKTRRSPRRAPAIDGPEELPIIRESPNRATSSSVSVPATSPSGPMHCRRSWKARGG
jgi:UDP-N-acetylmuramate--alanine ligase